jgi:2-polyprenyl-6-methoxyphenol hydroxylase-like FAD-dependent oxidoreductase
MRAVIAGGGIGGLTTALALRKAGLDVVVLERAPHLRAAGCGVHLWTNAVLALADLGIADDLLAVAPAQERCEFQSWDGAPLATWPVHEFREKFGRPVVAVGRDFLITTLATALGEEHVRGNAQVLRYEQHDDSVAVHLADGDVVRGDLLIGADGVHSAVRRQLLGDAPPDYLEEIAWRAAVDLDHPLVDPDAFRCLLGPEGRFVIYPIGPGRVHWMSVTHGEPGGRDGADVRERLLERHRNWAAPVADLIEATPAESILRSDIVDRDPDRMWGDGRVTLLGDAAHPMSFHVGQGACQAIEDGVALAAQLLTGTDPVAALRAYETERQPRTAYMQRTARAIGRMGGMNHPATSRRRSSGMGTSWEGATFARLAREMTTGARWPEAVDLREEAS